MQGCLLSGLGINEVKYVRTVTVTTIYACYITIDLSMPPLSRLSLSRLETQTFKGLAQLALYHVLVQKLYGIGWFSHCIRFETKLLLRSGRSLNTGAKVSSHAVCVLQSLLTSHLYSVG